MPNQANNAPNNQNAGKPAAQQPRKEQDMDKKSDNMPDDKSKMKEGGSCGC